MHTITHIYIYIHINFIYITCIVIIIIIIIIIIIVKFNRTFSILYSPCSPSSCTISCTFHEMLKGPVLSPVMYQAKYVLPSCTRQLQRCNMCTCKVASVLNNGDDDDDDGGDSDDDDDDDHPQ